LGLKRELRSPPRRTQKLRFREGLLDYPVQGRVLYGIGIIASLFVVSVAAGAIMGKLSMDGPSKLMSFISDAASPTEAHAAHANDTGRDVSAEVAAKKLGVPDPGDILDSPDLEKKTYEIQQDDNLFTALKMFGVPDATILEWAEISKAEHDLSRLKPGQTFSVYASNEGEHVRFEYNISKLSRLVILKDGTDYQVFTEEFEIPIDADPSSYVNIPRPAWVDPLTGNHYYRGVVKSSFYESAISAGMTPGKVMALIRVFGTVNFDRDIRAGDRFSVVVGPGEKQGDQGLIQAAMIETGRKPRYIFRFEQGEQVGYYSASGKEACANQLICPLHYTRISSGYTHRRYHPILKRYRPHLGVDYAAPSGKPIWAAANGRITYAGWKGDYGRTVEVKHNSSFTTHYAHLSRLAKGIRPGVRVKQGQIIGYVGSSGLSTGPHLDYRVYRNGKAVNPLKVTGMPGPPVRDQKSFDTRKQEMLAEILKDLPCGPAREWRIEKEEKVALAKTTEK